MAGRSAPRPSAAREQASSPMKVNKRVNKPRSPTKPMSRTTRSASRDLGESEVDMRTKKTKRSRAVREGSTDSVGSAVSVEVKAGRRRKNARVPATIVGDLSMVEEEQEKEQADKRANVPVDEGTKATQSPGGMSNLSGTTALTTQSEQKMADLDTGMVVELVPDLAREAFQLLDLLAPSKNSPEFVGTVIKELQVPGSGRGRRLRLRERTFDNTKENYGGELLIDPALILRKLFGDVEPSTGDFRPDVVLHAANIAAFVKELLVAQRDNPSTMYLLQRVDDVFPTPFLSGFEVGPKFGSSALLEPTFKLALDLRTQTSIAIFKVYRDEMNFDPDELLAALFYEPPAQRNETLTPYEDLVRNGQCRRMGGISAEALPLSEGQVLNYQPEEILKRVESIREAFNVEGNGSIDYVDFDKLHERFPWTDFLANVIQWCQLRLDEINKNIEKQGGIDNITRSLVEKVKGSDSQIELYYEPSKATQPITEATKGRGSLLPAATIIPASAGKSLYNSPNSIHVLLKKPALASLAPPSNQQHPAAPLRRSAEPQTHKQKSTGSKLASSSGAATNIIDEQIRDEDDMASDDGERSAEEVLSLHYEGETYNHKENLQPRLNQKTERRRFVDPQPNAERVTWSQDREEGELEAYTTRKAKRRHQAMEDDIQEEDEAFETDPRPLDQSRRDQAVRSVTQARKQIEPTQPASKRQRIGFREPDDEESVAAAGYRRGERTREELEVEQESSQEPEVAAPKDDGFTERKFQDLALQSSAQASDDAPPSSYPFVHETARAAMMKYRVQNGPQQRLRWSTDETETLINLIDKYGCSWATILKKGRGNFGETRDQVSLKDKARNIKVELLIAGAVLPRNFNGVALGRKEKEKVKANHMNPYRLEGELVGEEMYDLDGNLVEMTEYKNNVSSSYGICAYRCTIPTPPKDEKRKIKITKIHGQPVITDELPMPQVAIHQSKSAMIGRKATPAKPPWFTNFQCQGLSFISQGHWIWNTQGNLRHHGQLGEGVDLSAHNHRGSGDAMIDLETAYLLP